MLFLNITVCTIEIMLSSMSLVYANDTTYYLRSGCKGEEQLDVVHVSVAWRGNSSWHEV